MCSVEECEKEVHAKGLCQAHYRQQKRRERGLKKPGPRPDPSKPRSRHNPEGLRGPSELSEEAAKERAPKKRAATDTHCANGHEFTEENSYIQENPNYAGGERRVCRICARNWQTKFHGRPTIPDDVPVALKNADKTHCKQGHPYDEENTFYRPDGSRWCRQCRTDSDLRQRLKKYGLTKEEFEGLLERSKGKCEICGVDEQHIDHDHETGEVRGILCNNCNNGLGRFFDSPELLRAALSYLEQEPVVGSKS